MPQKAGMEICVKIVAAVKNLTGVAGIHIMAYDWESSVSEIVGSPGLTKQDRGD